MQKTLLGKKAVITGSTTGIGMAVARALAREGCDVMLSGLGDMEKIEFFRAALMAEFEIQAFYNEADLRHGKEASGIINDAQSRLGGVDIFVHNASLQQSVKVDELSLNDWQDVMAVNVTAAFHAIRTALPIMRRRAFGRIINIASVHGMVARPRQAALAAGNHALLGLTKVIALETAAENITCNGICPGFADTSSDAREISKHAERVGMGWDEAKDYLLGKRQPNQRLIATEEVAELVVHLCQQKASGITGATIPIDGGWTAQ
jgi:3-hydroxybutyrate dehydrogenase